MQNTSYTLFPLANHRVLSSTTLLCAATWWLSLNYTRKKKTKKKQPSESYSMFQLRSKTMSSRIKQQSSDNRSSLWLCVNTDSFVLHFVPFCLSGSSEVAATMIKRLQIAITAAGAKAAAYKWYLPNIFRDVRKAICSTCYVAFMTGSTMRKQCNRRCRLTFLSIRVDYHTHTQTHIDSFLLLMKLFYKNCTCAESVMRLPWRGRIRKRDGKRGSWKKKKTQHVLICVEPLVIPNVCEEHIWIMWGPHRQTRNS